MTIILSKKNYITLHRIFYNMKKCVFLLILLLICPLFVFGCSSETASLNEYVIKIKYDNLTHTASASENVTYYNVSDDELDNICFHLYPNAFRENAKNEVVVPSSVSKAYPNGKSYGEINIESVKKQGYDLNYEITGEDENILKVNLEEKLEPGENIAISIDFNLLLPNINHRFGYGDNTVNFGNFYPIVCVYEDNEFTTDLYSANGDPFYSECSKYNVEIKYDKSFVLASTGEEYSTAEENSLKVTKLRAENVRDFCFVLSDKFNIIEGNAGKTKVKYFYYDDEDPNNSLQTAIKSINTFNNSFGIYPYAQYSVVECNFVYGGMEFPELVMISDDLTNKEDYQYVIIHETAHQWWYGIVGNNQYENAWIDEGLAEYSTAVFYDKNPEYGVKYKNMIRAAQRNYDIFVQIFGDIYCELDTSMNRRLCDFKTEPEYVNCTYTKGMLMFNQIREEVGEKKLEKALRKFFDEKKYKNTTYAEFLKILAKHAGNKAEKIILINVEK